MIDDAKKYGKFSGQQKELFDKIHQVQNIRYCDSPQRLVDSLLLLSQ